MSIAECSAVLPIVAGISTFIVRGGTCRNCYPILSAPTLTWLLITSVVQIPLRGLTQKVSGTTAPDGKWAYLSQGIWPFSVGRPAANYLQEFIRQTRNTRLIWGSDCPFVGDEANADYASSLNWFFETVPSEADRNRILGINAIRQFFDG
ncbi:MAG: amidohydrolase family protein [Rhodobacteraceae bacterium]|nr:amidohydrolase family protein [Paracoccaceae bacterium]